MRTINGLIEDDDDREALIKFYTGVLKDHPDCEWARNELKYIDTRYIDRCSVVVSGGAYTCDNQYHGGYSE